MKNLSESILVYLKEEVVAKCSFECLECGNIWKDTLEFENDEEADIYFNEEGGYSECPKCGGEGQVVECDYLDDKAIKRRNNRIEKKRQEYLATPEGKAEERRRAKEEKDSKKRADYLLQYAEIFKNILIEEGLNVIELECPNINSFNECSLNIDTKGKRLKTEIIVSILNKYKNKLNIDMSSIDYSFDNKGFEVLTKDIEGFKNTRIIIEYYEWRAVNMSTEKHEPYIELKCTEMNY